MNPSKEIYKNWRNEFLVSNNKILKKYSINLNKNYPLIFNKSYISNHEFNKQKIINIDDDIENILIGLSHIYKEFDRLLPLISIKPKYYGFVDIISTLDYTLICGYLKVAQLILKISNLFHLLKLFLIR